VVDDVSVDSETLLVTDFVNLKIKLVQFFEGAHKDRVYICVFILEYSNIYNCVGESAQDSSGWLMAPWTFNIKFSYDT
jgi:hypothetical protein